MVLLKFAGPVAPRELFIGGGLEIKIMITTNNFNMTVNYSYFYGGGGLKPPKP